MRKRPATRPLGVVVVAASAGGLVPLRRIAAALPPEFPGAILIASHASRRRASLLPAILSADGPLPATFARDGQSLEAGTILVAPMDRHLCFGEGATVRATRHPVDARNCPSADVLFESAARTFGRRAVGIVLSGLGSDGAKGLAAIRAAGGIAIVQSPDDAQCPWMPRSALDALTPDACLVAADIAAAIDGIVRQQIDPRARPRARSLRRWPARGQSVRGLRILLVENRSLFTSEIAAILRTLGCSAAGPVRDVDSGLRLLAGDDADVDGALIDVDLGSGDVFALATALRGRDVRIVFAIGSASAPLPPGWADCPRVAKPFEAKALAAAFQGAVRTPPPVATLLLARANAPVSAAKSTTRQDGRTGHALVAGYCPYHSTPRDACLAEQLTASMRSVSTTREAVAGSRMRLLRARTAMGLSSSRTRAFRRRADSALEGSHRGGDGS